MASILELYGEVGPDTGNINKKGTDKTPIQADGGLDLSKDATKLNKARNGQIQEKKYSDTFKAK
jgi:expansin (peptidoglycan-binding protein)